MADPSSSADEHDFPEEDEGGGESTVSMTSPQIDPAMPSPISVAPPPVPGGAPGAGHRPMPIPIQMQMPTAPVPFTPGGGNAAFPVQQRPAPASSPSLPTPFGGLTPQGAPASPPKPLPAAGAPAREPVMSFSPGVAGASAGNAAPGMKRPQTVIGLAPPPVGAPRPGSPGAGRVPLPSGRLGAPGSAPRAAVSAPADKPPPSSGRGVRPPAIPATPPAITEKDADSTDEQLAIPEDIPDSHKEEMATMAKSPEESLALFGLGGLDSGLTNAARAAVPPKPTPAAGRAPVGASTLASPGQRSGASPMPGGVQEISPLTPDQQTRALPGNLLAAAVDASTTTPLPVLHDRTEEEESTRAVSREEMLRGHDAVIIGEDGESAQGEDATLAVGPGFNEANPQNLAAFAATLNKDQAMAQGLIPAEQQGGFPPPYGQQPQPQPYGADPSQQPQQQQPWQDPNAQAWQQQQSQQPQDPNAWQQQQPSSQQNWQGAQSYVPIGPVSGPHMPAAHWQDPNAQQQQSYPQSNPHMQVPQSNPHLQVPQSGHFPQAPQQNQGPIPFPGQPVVHQAPHNPFGDWNASANPPRKKFALSGQVLLLAVVGTVCLAIFITGIVLFATTKF